jgi:hypothetical protein
MFYVIHYIHKRKQLPFILTELEPRGRMVVEFTTTCAIVAYHHLSSEFEPHSWRYIKYHVNPETDKKKIKISGDGSKVSRISNFVVLSFSVITDDLTLSSKDQNVFLHC